MPTPLSDTTIWSSVIEISIRGSNDGSRTLRIRTASNAFWAFSRSNARGEVDLAREEFDHSPDLNLERIRSGWLVMADPR